MSGNLTAHQCQYVIEMLAAMAVGRPVIAYGAGGYGRGKTRIP